MDLSAQLSYWKCFVRTRFRPNEQFPRGLDDTLEYSDTMDVLATDVHRCYCECFIDGPRRELSRAYLEHYSEACVETVLLSPRESFVMFPIASMPNKTPEERWIRGAHALVHSLRLRGHHPWRRQPSTLARAYFRDVIEQNTHQWYALRPYVIGGSSLAEMLGQNNYENDQGGAQYHEQPLQQLKRHLLLLPPEDFTAARIRAFLKNGHTFEHLGRRLFECLTGIKVEERGTGISPLHWAYSHSPDGLIFGNPNTPNTPTAMIEIKYHSNYTKPPETLPGIYIAQCVQGMVVHNVPVCYYVGITYKPMDRGGILAQATIEVLYRCEKSEKWMYRMLDMYARALDEARMLGIAEPQLPVEYYVLMTECPFTSMRREIQLCNVFDMLRPGCQLQVDLRKVLSPNEWIGFANKVKLLPDKLEEDEEKERQQKQFKLEAISLMKRHWGLREMRLLSPVKL